MNESHILAKALRALAVNAESMGQAALALSAAGRPADHLQRLHAEWLNDTVVFHGERPFREAAREPGSAFLAWLDQRLAQPYHVTFRAHDAVRARHGDEAALLLAEVRWAQEVAWAQRMRGSDNDRIVFLAGMWLAAAERDPAARFRDLADCHVAVLEREPAYSRAPQHLLAETDILDGVIDDRHWTPLWLRFAEQQFGPMVNGMSRGKLAAVAGKVRAEGWAERQARLRSAQLGHLASRRPALMVAVLGSALEHGLSSDDVLAAERRFRDEVQAGTLDLSAFPAPPWRLFMQRLDAHAELAPAPSPAESAARIEALRSLPPCWTDGLPEDFSRLGASDPMRLACWFGAIAPGGARLPPEDPVVDYGMWLIEHVDGDRRAGMPPLTDR